MVDKRSAQSTTAITKAWVLLHPSLEIGYWFSPRYSVSLYYEQSSNGESDSHNEGLNNAGVRFGLGFLRSGRRIELRLNLADGSPPGP